jgi:AsmA protein
VSRDPKALSTLAASGRWHYDGKQALLDQLEVQLDDSHLTGTAGVTDLKTMALAFNLALDRIDIDRYRPPPQPASKPAAAPAQGKSSSDALKTLQLDGNLTLGSAVFAGLKVSNVHLVIHAGEGITHLAPVSAQLYGGQYSGDITLDDRGALLQSRLEQTLTAVDVAQLLQDLAKTQRLSGRGNITTSLTARGADAGAVLRSLNGKVTANLDNGAVQGVDLWFEINRAMALVQKQGLPSGSSSGRTKFDSFKASADVVNGVATTKDLNIASQNLRVTGAGTSNLVTEAVNYQVNAMLLKGAPAAGKAPAALGAIPLSISGSMASPQVRVDLQGLAKAQLQQQLDKHKGELKDQLQNKLKDLLK